MFKNSCLKFICVIFILCFALQANAQFMMMSVWSDSESDIQGNSYYALGAYQEMGFIDLANTDITWPFDPNTYDFSLSMWIKLQSVPASDMRLWDNLDALNDGFSARYDATKRFTSEVSGTDVYFDDPDTDLGATGIWHHAVFTYDRDGMAQFWLDGVSNDWGSIAGITMSTADELVLGVIKYGGFTTPGMPAWIDEAAIFSEVLTSNQIQTLYNNGDGLYVTVDDFPNALAIYHFDSTYGDMVMDSGPSNFWGIARNCAQLTSQWAPGLVYRPASVVQRPAVATWTNTYDANRMWWLSGHSNQIVNNVVVPLMGGSVCLFRYRKQLIF